MVQQIARALGATVTIPVGFTESLADVTDADEGVGGGEVESPSRDSPRLDGSGELDRVALVALLDWTDVKVWTVLPGDNLAAIAREFDTTIEAIAFYNNIAADDSIFIGQTIDVPVGFERSLTPSGG